MKKILGIIACGILVAVAAYAADTTFNDTTIDGDLTVTGTITSSGAVAQALASGKIQVGQTNGMALAVTPHGDATMSVAGVIAIGTGVIVNADIATNAAIAASKLADADLGDVSIAAGVVSIDAGVIINADISATAAIAASKLSGVAAAPTVAGSVSGTTNTVTITATDGASATIAAKRLVRVWMSETSGGVPSTNNIESLTLSGGAAIQTVTAAADYVYLTAATGIASAEVIGTAAGTNYVNVADGGYVTSIAVVFE